MARVILSSKRLLAFCIVVGTGLPGCAVASSHYGGVLEHPAVVPLLDEQGPDTLPVLVGSGVPRRRGRVVTALHVISHGFPVPGSDCGPARAVGGFLPHEVPRSAPDAKDIAWIDTRCVFDRVDEVTAIAPAVGTVVTLAGYPSAVFSGAEFATGSPPPPQVLRGEVVDVPVGLASDMPGTIWVEVSGVWSEFMPGFSGGPCAYKDDAGEWVVFGVAQFRLGDEVWQFLGVDLPVRAGAKRAIIAVAPIPEGWETEDRTPPE